MMEYEQTHAPCGEYKYVICREENVEWDPIWQSGHNRTLALQFSLHRHVVLVEAEAGPVVC